MKRVKFLNLFVAAMVLATGAVGCKKTPKNITPIPASRRGLPDNPGMSGPITSTGPGLGESSTSSQNLGGSTGTGELAPGLVGANEDRATLAAQSVYFDFDRSAIKLSEQGKLDQVATYMKSAPPAEQLRIEGNCDERGTEEYNRALGERRAIAARDYLIQKHGIESSRITTVSNGEDKPVDLGKTEEAYAKNRHDDFVILKP